MGTSLSHPRPLRVNNATHDVRAVFRYGPMDPKAILPARPVNVSRDLVGGRVFCGSYFARLKIRWGTKGPSFGSGIGFMTVN